jgi:HlyD family secretion protein
VVAELRVDKGDRVKKGALLALLEEEEVRAAAEARAVAELRNAEAELRRNTELHSSDVISDATQEELERAVEVARAELRAARAELARMRVLAPIDGEVVDVYAREGERVGPEGLLELGRTHEMYAVAEVYETDVGRVRVGQRARVTSPGLPGPLAGSVERIGRKVGKLDEIGADPAARTDARVVEVEVRLDDAAPAAGLTNLQVEVVIEP